MTRTDDTARERQLERYLLGTLSDDEKNRLELELVADETLFSQLEATEDDLIDRYIHGEVNPTEHRLFEELLQTSVRVRERLLFARALHELANQPADRSLSDRRLPAKFTAFRAEKPPRAQGVTRWVAWAACLVALIASGYLMLLNGRLEHQYGSVRAQLQEATERAATAQKEAETAAESLARATVEADSNDAASARLREELLQRNQQIEQMKEELANARAATPATSDSHPAATILFLALATRTSDELAILARPTERPVELQLDLDRIQPKGPLTATVKRDGVSVWEESGLEPVFAGTDTMLSLNLPAEVLFPGSYSVLVNEEESSRGAIGSYRFDVH